MKDKYKMGYVAHKLKFLDKLKYPHLMLVLVLTITCHKEYLKF